MASPRTAERPFQELKEALDLWYFWVRLATLDIELRYRRTVLGPFWLTLSGAMFLFALGFVFSTLFGQNIREYLPYIGAGLIFWWLISTMITEGCQSLIESRQLFLQRRTSIWLPALRVTLRNLIVFAHHFVVFCLIALIFGVSWNASLFLLIPGLGLIALNGVWVGVVLGVFCLRFRDLPQLVTVLVSITIFVTPIFWKREMLPEWRTAFADVNPLFHFIELGRQPLLGQTPALISYLIVIGMTLFGWALAYFVVRRYRNAVAYWL